MSCQPRFESNREGQRVLMRGMRPRGRKLLVIGAWLVASVLILFAILSVSLRLAFVRNFISNRLESSLHRKVTIGGPVGLRARPWPAIELRDLQLANAPWSREPQMLDIMHLSADVRLLPLIFGRIEVSELALDHPNVALERNQQREANWVFNGSAEEKKGGVSPVTIEQLSVNSGVLKYRDSSNQTDLEIHLAEAKASDGSDALKFEGSGRYIGLAAKAEGTGGPLINLRNSTEPYPLEGTFTIGNTTAKLRGTITGLMQFYGADLNLELTGDSMADLFPILRLTLPPTPPYSLKARLYHAGSRWRLDRLSGKVGDSDIAGSFVVLTGGERPSIVAKIHSKRLDLDDLGGFVGAPPNPEETASAKQKRAADEKKNHGKILPNTEWSLERLNAVNADLFLKAESIRGIANPIDQLSFHLVLKDGVAQLDPIDFRIADGRIKGTAGLNAKQQPFVSNADIEFRRINLSQVFPDSQLLQRTFTVIGGRGKLSGRGNSIAQILGEADGEIGIASRGGNISNMLLEILGLDAGEILELLFAGDKEIKLRCAAADFEIEKGKMKSKTMVVDTSDTAVFGSGTIDLAEEKFDLVIEPEPKDISILSARGPIAITGGFSSPTVMPKAGNVIIRGGASVALGFLNPIAALVPLIETGPGEDQPCRELIQRVKHSAEIKDKSLKISERDEG